MKTHISQLNQVIQGTSISVEDIQRLNMRISDWLKQAAEPEINARRDVNNYKLGMDDIKTMMRDGKGKFYMDTIRREIKDVVKAEETLIITRAESQQASSSFVISFTILGTLFAIAFSLFVAFFIIRGISAPINLINKRLRYVTNGDLTKRINLKSKNELGELSGYLDEFLSQLQTTIQEITESTCQLATSASQVKSATSESSVQLNNQADETIQVATAINQMAASIDEVARSTEAANESASIANSRAVEGNSLVQETLSSVKNLTDDVDSSAQVLAELKSHSEKIGTVLDVIKGIAEQTNLLALNAAIEAARAGEQGRGFAVVADEVRTLAKRTQDSTSEIEAIISDLQLRSEEAVTVMEQSRNKSAGTREKAEQMGTFLASINESISMVLDMNTQISTAAQQQSAVTQDVNRGIVNIEEISKTSASNAKETKKNGENLANLSDNLQNLVAKFKV